MRPLAGPNRRAKALSAKQAPRSVRPLRIKCSARPNLGSKYGYLEPVPKNLADAARLPRNLDRFGAWRGGAHAQSNGVNDVPPSNVLSSTSGAGGATATKPGAVAQANEYAKGGLGLSPPMNRLISDSVTNAVTISHSVRAEADKFAFGLGVITWCWPREIREHSERDCGVDRHH